MTSPSLPLELLNGASFVVDGFFIVWGVWYLYREGLRRKVPFWRRFLKLSAPMNFVVAVVVHDAGVVMRSAVIWLWRRAGAGDLGPWQLFFLTLGAAMIVVGGLCKVRAVTKPAYGDAPWLACLYCLVIFLAGSLITR